MLSKRVRKYTSLILNPRFHQEIIIWKKANRDTIIPLPGRIFFDLVQLVSAHFVGFDILTVPAPSFHTYDHYPIWNVAKELSVVCSIHAKILFPSVSGKTKMCTFGSLQKNVQDIKCPPGLFVLVLDDILTTGHTMKVSAEAIAMKGSFPACLAIA